LYFNITLLLYIKKKFFPFIKQQTLRKQPYRKTLKGYAYPIEKVILEIESPVGSGKLTKVTQRHYYIIDKEKNLAYDLYFFNVVTGTTIDKILKSFK
jgi:hypothetical protein